MDIDREKWLQIRQDANRKHVVGKHLTLEETAAMLWNPDDIESKPMSCMGILKIERRALDKLKLALKKFNITGVDDMFEPKSREYGTPISAVYDM